jgi:ribosomal protein L24E
MTSLSLETRFVSTFKKMEPENIKHYKNPEKLKWNSQNKSTAGEGRIVPV